MTFKATVLGAAASLLAFSAALAADLPSFTAPPPPPPPPPAVYDWSGYHIGISGGWGGGEAKYLSNVTLLTPFGLAGGVNIPSSYGTSGYLVGFQSGASWQLQNNLVLGYESEFNYADVSSNNNGGYWGDALNSNMRWFGAERLRIGYAFGRLLPYVTGGFAYGQLHTDGVSNFAGYLFPTSVGHWQGGWTVGAGLEYAVLNNVSVKAEWLYANLQGNHGGSVGVPSGYRAFIGNGFNTNVARVGINYQLKSLGALIGMPELGL